MSQESTNQSHQEIKNEGYETDKLDTGNELSITQKMPQVFSSLKECDYYDSEKDFMPKSAVEEMTPGASAIIVGVAPMPIPTFVLKNTSNC